MNNLTFEQKEILFRDGYYAFKAPPVCPEQWTFRDWINFIDTYGGWLDHKFIQDGGEFND